MKYTLDNVFPYFSQNPDIPIMLTMKKGATVPDFLQDKQANIHELISFSEN